MLRTTAPLLTSEHPLPWETVPRDERDSGRNLPLHGPIHSLNVGIDPPVSGVVLLRRDQTVIRRWLPITGGIVPFESRLQRRLPSSLEIG